MCLILKSPNEKVRIAKHDIVCYKIVEKVNSAMRTPFMYHLVTMGTRETDTIEKTLKKTTSAYVHFGFHSYRNKKELIPIINEINSRPSIIDRKYYIIKCTIPKGSKYYSGMSSKAIVAMYDIEQLPSYCSNSIRYDYIVDLKEFTK